MNWVSGNSLGSQLRHLGFPLCYETQDKQFDRLLKAVDEEIELGNIKDRVVVQAGYTKYKSKNQ